METTRCSVTPSSMVGSQTSTLTASVMVRFSSFSKSLCTVSNDSVSKLCLHVKLVHDNIIMIMTASCS